MIEVIGTMVFGVVAYLFLKSVFPNQFGDKD